MKKILLILLLASCTKADVKEECKTCELKVHHIINGQVMDYIEESRTICDGSYKEIDGVITSNGHGTNSTGTWSIKKQWICK